MFELIINDDDNWFYTARYNMPKDAVISLNHAKRIIIYGAGKIGTKVYQNMKKYSWNIVGFAVSDKNIVEEEKEGLPIKSIYHWIQEDSSCLIVIAAGEMNKKRMKETLNELAVTDYICV